MKIAIPKSLEGHHSSAKESLNSNCIKHYAKKKSRKMKLNVTPHAQKLNKGPPCLSRGLPWPANDPEKARGAGSFTSKISHQASIQGRRGQFECSSISAKSLLSPQKNTGFATQILSFSLGFTQFIPAPASSIQSQLIRHNPWLKDAFHPCRIEQQPLHLLITALVECLQKSTSANSPSCGLQLLLPIQA